MTYTKLLPTFLCNALVEICYPKFYDANGKCDYHGGAVGHSSENCQALKFKVQWLIDSG